MSNVFLFSYICLFLIVVINSYMTITIYRKALIRKSKDYLHENERGIPNNTVFPILNFRTLDEKAFNIVDLDKKGTIVLFTSITCDACKSLYPTLNTFVKKHKHINFLLLIASDSITNVKQMLSEYDLNDVPTSHLSAKDASILESSIYPFGYYLKPDGTVNYKGVVNKGDLELLLRLGFLEAS
ncbi:thioredoxin domain-containing protein [Paenibacillus sp. S-12]|uniref:TlpA family protein disulfide reductase n=1 Tax=Paenibacillus sp. S-12 TaxID=3031371 RepID=UPI0025A1F620|nr:thioredoxin domain-containing protein [Paenibacillus sp. S-12]